MGEPGDHAVIVVTGLPEEHDRAKAVHDHVATTVAYDAESLVDALRAPQDADTVSRMGEGVCAGYANLMVALGQAAGLDVFYLTGHSR